MRSPHETYPPDEFDAVAPAGPRGAHRAPRTALSRWWPFIAVLVVVPVVAFGLVTWLSDWDGLPSSLVPGASEEEPAGEDEPPADDGASEGTEGEGTEGEAEQPAPEATEEPPPPPPAPDLAFPVEVFNATNRSGLAGRAGDTLEGAGFTSITTGNWDQADPPASVVRHPSPETAATAQAVADALGIATVEQSADVSSVVVVLMDDFAG